MCIVLCSVMKKRPTRQRRKVDKNNNVIIYIIMYAALIKINTFRSGLQKRRLVTNNRYFRHFFDRIYL